MFKGNLGLGVNIDFVGPPYFEGSLPEGPPYFNPCFTIKVLGSMFSGAIKILMNPSVLSWKILSEHLMHMKAICSQLR